MLNVTNSRIAKADLLPVVVVRSSVSVGGGAEPLAQLRGEVAALLRLNAEVGRSADALAAAVVWGPAALAAGAARVERGEGQRGACIKRIARLMPQAVAAQPRAFNHGADSSWRLAADAVVGINDARENYVRLRADIAKSYTEYYSGITGVNAAITKAVTAGGDTSVKIDITAVVVEMRSLKAVWDGKKISTVAFSSDELKREYGASFFKTSGGGLFIDTGVLEKMIDALESMGAPGETQAEFFKKTGSKRTTYPENLPNAKYNPWRTTFDGQENQIQTQMRQAAERYSHSNTKFSSLTDLLMKIIDALYKTDQLYWS